ncbi:hypothetical protein ZWY2020_003063 [Hordeum vulgare]|nr:hypothetical protein ZWY2020_003063 [Hordeum vulgare]
MPPAEGATGLGISEFLLLLLSPPSLSQLPNHLETKGSKSPSEPPTDNAGIDLAEWLLLAMSSQSLLDPLSITMMPLNLYFLSIPLPVSTDADLVKHAVDVVCLPTPIMPPPRALQFQRPIIATSPSSSSSPSLLPHLLCYQPPQVPF